MTPVEFWWLLEEEEYMDGKTLKALTEKYRDKLEAKA